MEPPAKRRRHGKSPLAGAAAADTDDDDELCFEPVELSAKRDPGYRLSLQRAYADSRFQATMAHIFEKYGRDFDGIGDEIDMVSGDIVVDNGHLQNMRDEADVGMGDDYGSDEEQAISLDQLMHVDGDDDDVYIFSPQSETSGTHAASHEQHDEEDDIMFGRKKSPPSQAVVRASKPRILGGDHPSPPRLLDGFCSAGGLGFGPSFAFGASPLGFGVSPLASSPWSLANGFSRSPWEPPSIPSRASRLLPSPGERYNFPAQDSGSSIWASNYRFKEDGQEPPPSLLGFGPMRPRPSTRTRAMKSICSSVAPPAGLEEEVDDDAILTGKRYSHGQLPKHGVRLTGQDGNDDELVAHPTPERDTAAVRERQYGTPCREESQAGSRRARRGFSGKPLDNSNGEREKAQSRKTPKASRGASQKQGPSRQRLTVEIAQMNPLRASEYEQVDDAIDEIADSADEALAIVDRSSSTPDKNAAGPEGPKDVLVSRAEPTSQSVSIDGEKSSGHDRKRNGRPREAADDSIFCLSDDEMPIWPGPREPPKVAGDKKPAAKKESKEPAGLRSGDSRTMPDSFGDTRVFQVSSANAPSPSTPRASVQSEKRRRTQRSKVVSIEDTSAAPPLASEPAPEPEPEPADDALAAPPAGAKSQPLARELRWLRKLNGPVDVPAHDLALPAADENPRSRPSRRAASGLGLEAQEHREEAGSQRDRDGEPEVLSVAAVPREVVPQADVPAVEIPEDVPAAEVPLDVPAVEVPEDVPAVEVPEGVQAVDILKDVQAAEVPEDVQAVEVPEGVARNNSVPSPGHVTSPTSPPSSRLAPAPLREHTPVASPPPPPPPPPSSKPQTPRHTSVKTTRAPSSRRSILSLISSDRGLDDDAAAAADDDDDDLEDLDELGRSLPSARSASYLSSTASRKIWKSSARTTEVYHTPVKRRPTDVFSPGSIIKTPGGTLRTCGLAGYRCGRDFCFSCL